MKRGPYKERRQLKHRLEYGELEKKKGLVKRLAEIKKQNADICAAKEDMRNKTGQEYFFSYNSKTDGACVHKTERQTAGELNKMKVYIDNEIHRSEKKMEKVLQKPMGTHIKFLSDGENENVSTEDCVFEFESGEKIKQEFMEYIERLKQKKMEVSKSIEALKRVTR